MFHADGQTHTTRLPVAFRNFAKAPKRKRHPLQLSLCGGEQNSALGRHGLIVTTPHYHSQASTSASQWILNTARLSQRSLHGTPQFLQGPTKMMWPVLKDTMQCSSLINDLGQDQLAIELCPSSDSPITENNYENFHSKTNQMHNISNLFYFGSTLYMFRTVIPSIIRSLRLYTQHQAYVIQVQPTACQQTVGSNCMT